MSISNSRFILHIDDDEDDQLMLHDAIAEIHPCLKIRKARNGPEGLQLLLQFSLLSELPFLILLDLNMPGMDGKQVLKEIKKNTVFATIPLVLFTTSSSPLDKMFAEKENVRLVTKPSNQAEFTECVRDLIESV